MLSWDGPGRHYRRSCVSYLEDVFELLDAAPGDARVPVLDDVIHLLNPVAMRARMDYVPAAYPRREVLADRVRVSTSLVTAEPATIAEVDRQLRDLRASPFGRWLRPSPDGQAADIDLSRDVAERAVVLFRLGGPRPAGSCAMLTRLVCQDLLAAGAALDGIGVDGDGIVWLAECGALPRPPVTEMIARGRGHRPASARGHHLGAGRSRSRGHRQRRGGPPDGGHHHGGAADRGRTGPGGRGGSRHGRRVPGRVA